MSCVTEKLKAQIFR